tara:strand:+ start:1595 stop:1822 length:228 start_codon:yes stop_codon:yes gene_type:complete
VSKTKFFLLLQAYVIGVVTCLYGTVVALFVAHTDELSLVSEVTLYSLAFALVFVGVLFTIFSLVYFIKVDDEEDI